MGNGGAMVALIGEMPVCPGWCGRGRGLVAALKCVTETLGAAAAGGGGVGVPPGLGAYSG